MEKKLIERNYFFDKMFIKHAVKNVKISGGLLFRSKVTKKK